MIRKKINLKSITLGILKNNTKAIGFSALMLGGFSHAQFKIDPSFDVVFNLQKKGLLNTNDYLKIAEENNLATSTIIQPNGKTENLFHVIVNTNTPKNFENSGLLIQSFSKNFFTALVTLDQITELSTNDLVINIMAPRFETSTNNVHVTESGAGLLQQGLVNNHAFKGQNVLIGVLDSGIDFRHPDFSRTNNPTESRILRIWDQTITANSNENPPINFNYGVEYTNAHINDEIDGTPTNFIRQQDTNGHGTHVAGTAAGNGTAWGDGKFRGVAPEAELVIVKAGNGSFSYTNIINGLDYFKKVSEDLNRPIVVNFSLGGQANAHNGTASHELKVNEFTQSGPGRVVVISAGNDGGNNNHQELALAPGEKKIFTLVASDTTSTSITDLFTFYTYHRGEQDRSTMKMKITAPNGNIFERDISGSSTFYAPHPNNSGNIVITADNYWETSTGKRYSKTNVKRANTNVPTAGTYKIEIENTSENNVIVDGWITSYNISVTNPNGDNNYTTGSPGNAEHALTVANYVGINFNMPRTGTTYYYSNNSNRMQDKNSSSSIGPRIDNLPKPEISADGTYVISALSSNMSSAPAASSVVDGQYYRAISGTSMSAPGVAGAVALLLEANPNLTSTEVKTAIINNSRKDEFTTQSFTPRLGYGKIDIYSAVLQEVNRANNNLTCPAGNYTILGYDTFGKLYLTGSTPANNQYTFSTFSGYNQRMAIKYTPNITGKLNSIYALLGSNSNTAVSPFQIEIRKANAEGKPGELIGTKTFDDVNKLQWYGWNTLDISELDVDVQTNNDIFVVFISDNHRLRYFADNDAVDGRTYFSNDQGNSYNVDNTLDAKVRIIIHENSSAVHQLATLDSSTTQNLNEGFNQFINNCEVVTRIESSGAIPVTGSTTTQIWLNNHSSEFVNRRVQVNNSTPNATGKITLFFNQEEFNTYNANNNLKLPTSGTDEANKGNLKIYFFSGESSNNSGLHTSYTNSAQIVEVDATQVKWNATYGYWEVTIDYLGAGGYFLSTANTLNNIDLSLNKIEVYPNPVVDILSINIPSDINEASFKLTDITGKSIKEQKLNSKLNKINLSQLTQGLYILEVKTEKGSINKKIIKK